MREAVDTGAGARSLADVVGIVADAQTYRNVLYLFLAFPLGIFYYVVLVLGFTLGVALSVILVGLVVLAGTVLGLRFVASFERGLSNRLLGTEIDAPDDVETDGGLVETTKAYLSAGSTWRGLGFVALKFPLGVLSFVLLVSLLGVALELLVLPLFPGGVFNVEVSGWRVARSFETATQRLLAVPVGAVLGVVALHVLNAFARANAAIASSLLGPGGDADEEVTSE
ncbi:sensor domain-containing protein [Halobacterium litoreum]|uniref:Sensor domain-containing protein n=1 Tax=Halobacterium litoreum TaxID=2039234 RepID=A0ABD5ND86_9EURY|nr:sensor domain-containing protein [Halobacterium litoreum]UHH13846.1 sensor domain-containing protein [Halobacterium litoreum]